MRHRNNYHTLFLLTILFLFQYCSKEGDKDIANIIESTEVIKEGTTNKNGIIIFKDRDTNEEVRIEVKDNNDNPIYNVKVGYIDLDGCEFFQIESQNDEYLPLLKIYSHKNDTKKPKSWYKWQKEGIEKRVQVTVWARLQVLSNVQGWVC